MARITKLWQTINASYWWYPGLFSLAGLALALLTVWLDRHGYTGWIAETPWLHPARPDGASTMLTIIASSMIGVASTVFSITIAAVAYASGSYGPRLLTNFMEDKGNQLSLATFLGNFVFALTVLRVVRAADEGPVIDSVRELPGFVPQLSLLVAYAGMAVAVMVLVYFLHHVPASIRINTVLKGIGERLIGDIQARFDTKAKERAPHEAEGRPVLATAVGYVQVIDYKRLERVAAAAGGHLHLCADTGDFLHPGVPLAHWEDADGDDQLDDAEVCKCYALGGTRTPNQDLLFLIDELVEIGLRALSPGVNDPFTAISTLHWLGAAVAELGPRELSRELPPSGKGPDGAGGHLSVTEPDFEHYVRRGFGSVRSGVATSSHATRVMFETLSRALVNIEKVDRREVLRVEGERLIAQAREHLTGPNLTAAQERYEEFCASFEREPATV